MIVLTDSQNRKVWYNPNYIALMFADEWNDWCDGELKLLKGTKIIMDDGGEFHAMESPEDINEKIYLDK